MTDKEINQKIQSMILSGEYDSTDIIRYVRSECQGYHLKPQTLGMLFELYAEVIYDTSNITSGFSRDIPISELKRIHPDFESQNGSQWARSDNSYLGKRYVIRRAHKNNKVYSVKLDGINNKSLKRNRGIRQDIIDSIKTQNCRILDIHSNIEVDHKDGHYDVLENQDAKTQNPDDFQPLSKAANDAKRQHCKRCIQTGKRYDARRLGYSEGFIVGDENTSGCQGCYWYDPKRFNQLIPKDFKPIDK